MLNGTLNISNAAALGTTAGTFKIASGTTINNSSGGSLTMNNYPINITGSFTFTGSNSLNLGTGAVTLASSTVTVSANTLTVGGLISGTGTLTKAGAGTMTLSGANTFTGGVTHNAGTLNLANSAALGTTAGTFTIASGTTINNTSGATLTTSNYPIAINGSFTFTGTNSLDFGTGNVTLNATPTITVSSSNLTFGGVISGAFGITHTGAGHLKLTNTASTFTGAVTSYGSGGALYFNSLLNVSGGSSSLGAPTTSGNGTITLGSITNVAKLIFQGTSSYSTDRIIDIASTTGQVDLKADGTSATITYNNLTVSGNGNKTLNVRGTNTGDNTIAATIPDPSSGTLSISKTEAGKWVFSGTNTYTGTTTISAGTLQIGAGSTTGSISNSSNISNSSALIVNRSNAYIYSGVISGTGTLAVNGGGTFTVSGANTYTGTTTITNGTLNLGASGVISNSSNQILNGGTFSTGSGAGYSETVGTLTLSDNSTINLGTGSHTLNFSASNGTSWTSGKTLTINGWAGNYDGTSGSDGKLYSGSSAELSGTKLSQIRFYRTSNSSYYSATQLNDGEIVPTSVLPVVFLNLKTTLNEKKVNITWQTTHEYNSNYFIVQRSFDGKNFFDIDTILSNNIFNQVNEYQSLDNSISENWETAYYRIKQIDLDGSKDYSKIQFVYNNYNNSTKINFRLFPNPANDSDEIHVDFGTDIKGDVKFIWYDQSGKLVHQHSHSEISDYGNYNIKSSNFIPSEGEYIIVIKTLLERYECKLVIK